jgi:rhodanese-related sulfurtransferase/DNA-binding transcriptional ArsR family regulator
VSSTHRQFKNTIYEQLARVGKAFAGTKRLELVDLLSQGPRTVEALAQQASISVANASQHLRVLRAARLVETEKKGLYVEYRLADEKVAELFVAFRDLAEARLAEIAQVKTDYFRRRQAMEPVASDELLRRAKRGEVTVLDVRPEEEFRAGHVAGALSIPVDDLRARLGELPKDREIIAYCRGPYCVMAVDAVELLRAAGFSAHHIERGVTELRVSGVKVAAAQPHGAR